MPVRFDEVKRRLIADLMDAGEPDAVIRAEADCSQSYLTKHRKKGGPRPRKPGPGHLTRQEREEILCGLAAGDSYREIGRRLSRAASTISREVAPWGRDHYRVHLAEARAEALCRRPKGLKLEKCRELAKAVFKKLKKKWSPEQISNWLKRRYVHDARMRVSPETIYKTLYIQGRGTLRDELTKELRSARAARKAQKKTKGTGRIANMVNISQRPPEANDRAVPGHWEGDLIIGRRGLTAVGTLVERSTRFVMLLHLPHGHTAELVRDALARKIRKLPTHLKRSLTWDQGGEMAQHQQFTIDTGVQVYFCDPYKPWQRGSNENTNGLLRQYLPDGEDLSKYSEAQLDAIAKELNTRPRKTLNWNTPANALSVALAA